MVGEAAGADEEKAERKAGEKCDGGGDDEGVPNSRGRVGARRPPSTKRKAKRVNEHRHIRIVLLRLVILIARGEPCHCVSHTQLTARDGNNSGYSRNGTDSWGNRLQCFLHSALGDRRIVAARGGGSDGFREGQSQCAGAGITTLWRAEGYLNRRSGFAV